MTATLTTVLPRRELDHRYTERHRRDIVVVPGEQPALRHRPRRGRRLRGSSSRRTRRSTSSTTRTRTPHIATSTCSMSPRARPHLLAAAAALSALHV